jgi:hypothetical protein
MGKEAHISNLFKELNHLLKKQQDKHIKLYSDNPIHDCIDRIINACACIDENEDYRGFASENLHNAAIDLRRLTTNRMIQINKGIARDARQSESD